MNIGFRLSSWKKGSSVKTYIQDGLVAIYDGIENVGFGKHDANSSVWKNLGSLGDAYNASRILNLGFTENGAIFNNSLQNIDEVFTIPGYLQRDIMGYEWSYELVFTPYAGWWQNISGIFGNHAVSSGCGIVGGQNDSSNSRFAFATYGDYRNADIYMPSYSFFQQNQIYVISVTANHSTGIGCGYYNGILKSSNTFGNLYIDFDDDTCLIGAALPSNDRIFDGIIHCVRIYNREISANEVASNYMIDVKRFNVF